MITATAVGADTPMTLQSVPPNGTTSRISDVFPDPGLASAVAEKLSKDVDNIVSEQELAEIESLPAGQRNIESIDGVQYLVNLESLDLENNQISDITPLAGLTGLEALSLWDNQISDITPLIGLTGLGWLNLGCNQISDISPLAGLTNLWGLYLQDNQISGIVPLAELTNLRYLDLSRNLISDISPIAGLTDLEGLSLWDNQISDITPLTGLTDLWHLNLPGNQINDIAPLSGLTDLWHLNLSNNQINDIAPLSGLTGLEVLDLSNQSIVLDNTTINTPTAFTVIDINGNPIDLALWYGGVYENGMLTWTELGDNGATWSTSVTIGDVTEIFSGTVSQYVRDYNINDILAVRDHILGKTPLSANERTMMDVNKDGIINIFDMLVMRDWILRRRINAELRMQNAELPSPSC
ncbi:MAG: leucine-rich repeat domain-containing protein [Oscillospiraceae bacterium]|nr:leucine-rich repeat domain-containing protein [Oscillospiraceae bacterium]